MSSILTGGTISPSPLVSERDTAKPNSVVEREARLAEALRRNLKRRKEQARGREGEEPADSKKTPRRHEDTK